MHDPSIFRGGKCLPDSLQYQREACRLLADNKFNKHTCYILCVFCQIMNFQIVPAAGLIPQAAVPVYGAPASSSLLGQVVGASSLIGPRSGQLPLLAAQGGGIGATSPASQAALLQGIRQPLGQPTVASGQAMLTGIPAAGARLIVPPSSQAMYMMHSLSGGAAAAAGAVIPAVDPASLMSSGAGTSTDDSVLKSSDGNQQSDGKCQTNRCRFMPSNLFYNVKLLTTVTHSTVVSTSDIRRRGDLEEDGFMPGFRHLGNTPKNW